ncbi:polysaccharide biosynthesis/export family protein [Shimia abyssi]|uniref:Polysaccharide export outer membrane protein n=1 Tax=Shimia abyssi TaxID=1662395 RepID=A0A2P8F8N7_9RHOB|nr:polysaccharide biosynthesis/export family protein [Shimia abyssi]PSL18022.1 polysaccharide export outer membrane protein [Shimia abyssi]
MRQIAGFVLATIVCALLASCTLPRGSAVKAEITGDTDELPDITVQEVTRNNVNEIGKWPSTGWHGHYHWFARASGPESILLKPGDKVLLTIWDNQANSLLIALEGRNVQVRPIEVSASGTVFVPYISQVTIGGMTPDQARQVIQDKLTAIAPSAQVQIEVKSGQRNSVDMVSGFRTPGTIELTNRNTSILSVISKSGGILESVQNPVVRLMRDGQRYEIPVDSLLHDPTKNVTVRGGDKIIIDEQDQYFIGMGATNKEELVYFDREEITALESISMLGGLQDTRANPKGLLVMRQYKPEDVKPNGGGPAAPYVIFTFDLTAADGLFGANNFQVNPDDIVLATESALKPAQAVIALVGSLFAINNIVN